MIDPALLGAGVEHGVDLALADDHVLLAADAGVGQQLLHVEQAARHAVDGVLAVAGAEQRAADRHLGELDGQQAGRVVDGEADLGPAERRALGRAGEDHVVHLLAAHGARRLRAEHPGDGVDDVRLARAVGPDDDGDARLELERGGVGEGLEALEGERSGTRRRANRGYRLSGRPLPRRGSTCARRRRPDRRARVPAPRWRWQTGRSRSSGRRHDAADDARGRRSAALARRGRRPGGRPGTSRRSPIRSTYWVSPSVEPPAPTASPQDLVHRVVQARRPPARRSVSGEPVVAQPGARAGSRRCRCCRCRRSRAGRAAAPSAAGAGRAAAAAARPTSSPSASGSTPRRPARAPPVDVVGSNTTTSPNVRGSTKRSSCGRLAGAGGARRGCAAAAARPPARAAAGRSSAGGPSASRRCRAAQQVLAAAAGGERPCAPVRPSIELPAPTCAAPCARRPTSTALDPPPDDPRGRGPRRTVSTSGSSGIGVGRRCCRRVGARLGRRPPARPPSSTGPRPRPHLAADEHRGEEPLGVVGPSRRMT